MSAFAAPDTTPIAPTEAPTETPLDTVAPTPEPSTPTVAPADDDEGIDLLPIVLTALGVILLIGVVSALASRRPKSAPARSTSTPPSAPSVQSKLLSTAQWIHDQLTLELLAATPVAAQQRWLTERTRLDDVVIGAQQQWADGHGTGWQQLAQSLSTLATAVDTNIALRVQPTSDATLIRESNDVVNNQRRSLQQLLTALWATTPR